MLTSVARTRSTISALRAIFAEAHRKPVKPRCAKGESVSANHIVFQLDIVTPTRPVIARSVFATKQSSRSKVAALGCFVAPLLAMTTQENAAARPLLAM